ncbi:MAG: Bug family tripartite tricarboxylate transporter substrate binding protein [bacterium]|jgi:tripartite-type tricarboxylate transporter receptor subunit TctC|nr:tripartite tricarboxylate transporter substrate binding protein [Betaproteobacteria bacterium]
MATFGAAILSTTLAAACADMCEAVAAQATGALATAQWPARAIRFVVPFPPGGPLDISARLIGGRLSEALGQPVLVDNRPGAGGSVGARLVAGAAGDGHTLLMGALSTHAVNPWLYRDVGYDPVRDFTPVTLVANVPNVLVVHPSLQADSVKALVALARSSPGKLAFGSGGSGSGGHLAGELLKSAAKLDLVHVPYKGAAPAMADLVGGQIPMMFDNLASALPQVRAGKVRALAVTTATRSAFLPELPTMQEAGVAGFDISTWFGVLAPAALPGPVLDRLHGEIARILQLPEVRERLATFGSEPVGSTPAQFAAFIRAEQKKYARIVRESGAKAD